MLNISFALSLNSIGCLTFSVHTYILTLPMLYPTIGIHPAAMPTTTNITIWKNFITIPTTILYKAPTRSEIIQGTAYVVLHGLMLVTESQRLNCYKLFLYNDKIRLLFIHLVRIINFKRLNKNKQLFKNNLHILTCLFLNSF